MVETINTFLVDHGIWGLFAAWITVLLAAARPHE